MDGARAVSLAAELRLEAWRVAPPAGPVLAAGSTGTVAATRRLLAAIARLPQGEVILPGLDLEASEALWQAAEDDPVHPQHAMARLLSGLGAERSDVRVWEPDLEESGALAAALPPLLRARRTSALRVALAPAIAFTELGNKKAAAAGLEGLSILACRNEEHEARAIAALLRDALEPASIFLPPAPEDRDRGGGSESGEGGGGAPLEAGSGEKRERDGAALPAPAALKAMLVTPSRPLARRVAAECRRWGLAVDDAGGVPFAETPPGVFLRLVLEAAEARWPPLLLLSVLEHPFARLGLPRGELRRHAARLERGPLCGDGAPADLAGLLARLAQGRRDAALLQLAARLQKAEAPLAAALAGSHSSPSARKGGFSARRAMEAHLALASALAAEAAHSAEDAPAPAPAAAAPPPPADSLGADAPDGPPPLLASATGESAPLFSGPGGAELARLLEGLWQSLGQDRARDLPAAWYPAAFRALLAEHAWRPPWGDARLAVLGPMEARLLSAELVVLGALNEGAWPRQPDLGPWMGRKMRRDLSLAPPELRIGQAARDFAESCAAPRVVLTWAERREGAPRSAIALDSAPAGTCRPSGERGRGARGERGERGERSEQGERGEREERGE